MNLYNKLRPKTYKTFVGNEKVVKAFRKAFEKESPPNSTIISGDFGLGKTTLVRIIKKNLEISDNDFIEMNPQFLEALMNSNYLLYQLIKDNQVSENQKKTIARYLSGQPSCSAF